MEKWSGKVAVVTGASVGIGRAIVQDFAENGIHVIGLARRCKKVEEIAKVLGETSGKIYAYRCDVSDPESVKDAFKWIEEKFGAIHILVNNAAIIYNGKITDESDEAGITMTSVIDINITGVLNCTRAGVRLMKKSDDYGMVININSIVGHSVQFMTGANIYAPTKHAMTAFSEVLRQEFVSENNGKIRVSNVSPGLVKTEIAVSSGIFDDIEAYDKIAHLMPEDIAQAVSFLLQTPYNVNLAQVTVKPALERV